MASKYWIKLYHEILDDPKMGSMPDHIWRRTVELFLMAGENFKDGELPPVNQVAWKLHTTEADIQEVYDALTVLDILECQDGIYSVKHFAKRQEAIPVNERVQRYRDSKQTDKYYGNETVTNRYTDRDIDTDIDKIRGETAAPAAELPARPAIYSLYESEVGPITPMIAAELTDAEKVYPAEWFPRAFEEAAAHNARNWKYVVAILKRWKIDGFKSDNKPSGNGKSRAPGQLTAAQIMAQRRERMEKNGEL